MTHFFKNTAGNGQRVFFRIIYRSGPALIDGVLNCGILSFSKNRIRFFSRLGKVEFQIGAYFFQQGIFRVYAF